jgi:Na+-transporting methylmalonyl-CoA/oxaloacetate decarboxylase gamma subunit
MSPAPALPVFLAALPAHPDLGEVIAFQINGLVVVLIALGLIWGLMELLGAFFRRSAAKAAAATPRAVAPAPTATPPAAASPAPPTAAPGEIPHTDLVLIAAAIHATLGPRARVIALSPRPEAHVWATEGRRAIFATHKVR